MSDKLRLSKLMAQKNLCSRREADIWIQNGWVTVDGHVVSILGSQVASNVKIELHPKAVQEKKQKVTILLCKPVGYVSCQPEKGYPAANELLTSKNQDLRFKQGAKGLKSYHFDGLAVAGRLDIDSQGLLVFTQDGCLARSLIAPSSSIEKEYKVGVTGEITSKAIDLLCHGLSLDGKVLRPAKVEIIGRQMLRFILREGRKRQIRRMCEAVGLKTTHLMRTRIGNIYLGNLRMGHWRFLGEGEFF